MEISVRYNNDAILSITAKSEDISCINESLIESVRFEFVKRAFLKPKEGSFINITNTFDSLLGEYHSSAKDLFVSEQGLLNDILNAKECKHYLHLKYLSTLDSEEATYIWHTERTRDALRITLDQIEEIITGIKKSGRQDYLKQDHPNFSRIMHDYSDAKKGFITWKGALDERIV